MAVPWEILTDIRLTAEADALVERIFGKELAEDPD
jgi:hypothetical protein